MGGLGRGVNHGDWVLRCYFECIVKRQTFLRCINMLLQSYLMFVAFLKIILLLVLMFEKEQQNKRQKEGDVPSTGSFPKQP